MEPPRAKPREYDAGPPTAFAPLLSGQQTGLPWPDFVDLGVTSDPSFGVGPIYRGRFSSISVLVLADPAEPDDVFTGRALTGESGQRLQAFLTAAGLTKKYLIRRTVPVETSDLSAAKRDALVDRPEVQTLHRHLIAALKAGNSGLDVILAVGRGCAPAGSIRRAAGTSGHSDEGFFRVRQPGRLTERPRPALHTVVRQRHCSTDVSPPTDRGQVPRADLPYGTPRWMGTPGTRGSRPTDRTTGKPSADYLKVYLPGWVNALPPPALSAADAATVALFS